MTSDLSERIFSLNDRESFTEICMKVYTYQVENNSVFNRYIRNLGREKIRSIADIAFLPAEFFRNHRIISEGLDPGIVFESSSTAGLTPSHHYVHDPGLYEASFLKTFRSFYGEPSDYLIAALLPSYVERGNSSLVYMTGRLIRESCNGLSGFYRDNIPEMIRNLQKARSSGKKTLLLGVSFALLDLAENYSPDLRGTIVMETGGMKGRRKEITREELHSIKTKLNVPEIHSEYGMTELLSQAYSKGNGVFHCPPWVKVLIRDPHDPLSLITETGKTGGINIIDLANLYSCSFIATSDLGKLHADGGFEVLGRFDESDVRGCNLLVS